MLVYKAQVCIIGLSVSLLFSACHIDSKSNLNGITTNDHNKEPWKVIQQIENSYNDSEIVETIMFEDYLLIESKAEGLANRFDWYNLNTKTKSILPTGPFYVELIKIVNRDRLLFLADGRNHVNEYISFPFIIECTMRQEHIEYENIFKETYLQKYINIEDEVTFGGLGERAIKDLKVTLNGIEILFEPVPGLEDNFFASFTSIPRTYTSYKNDTHQIIIDFNDTNITTDLSGMLPEGFKSEYIKSFLLEEHSGTARLIIDLKEQVKYYTTTTHRMVDSMYPYVKFYFAESLQNNDIPYDPEGR